jgi:hypothetical protein
MLRYFSSWSALAVSTRPCQLPKLLSALTIAQRSLAQKGQKPAPMKNTSVLPLGRLSASSETCMNLPRTFRGMKLLLGLLLVLTTRKCSVVYLLMFGIRIISPDTQAHVRWWQVGTTRYSCIIEKTHKRLTCSCFPLVPIQSLSSVRQNYYKHNSHKNQYKRL